MAAQGPWGQNFGPLNLTPPLHPLPQGSRNNVPKLYGNGKQHPDEHIVEFHIACGILGVEYEGISIHLFVETLQGVVADQFYHLAPQTTTTWDILKFHFETHFKTSKDGHTLLAQLTSMKKEPYEPMRDFLSKFNKLKNRISANSQPTAENLKCFFINAQLSEVSFLSRRTPLVDVIVAQTQVVEIEDHLILLGKIKKDPNKTKVSFSIPEVFGSSS